MLALSLKQPFGTAMLYEKIETRTWQTQYRGLVLICTSKKPYDLASVVDICGSALYDKMIDKIEHDATAFLYGYAIAVGKLVDCRPMQREDEEKAFVKYFSDLYCHVYEDVQPIFPIPWKGAQRWKKVEQSIIDEIQYM